MAPWGDYNWHNTCIGTPVNTRHTVRWSWLKKSWSSATKSLDGWSHDFHGKTGHGSGGGNGRLGWKTWQMSGRRSFVEEVGWLAWLQLSLKNGLEFRNTKNSRRKSRGNRKIFKNDTIKICSQLFTDYNLITW